MNDKYGILITCEEDENGDVTVTYDDIKFVKDNLWRYQGVVTSHTIKKDKLSEKPDYGLAEDVRERGLLPLSFGMGSNLLTMIKARLLSLK